MKGIKKRRPELASLGSRQSDRGSQVATAADPRMASDKDKNEEANEEDKPWEDHLRRLLLEVPSYCRAS